jgi:hypothetical protein
VSANSTLRFVVAVIVFAAVIMFSCSCSELPDRSDSPTTWTGIPLGARCGWSRAIDFSDTPGTCVVGGHAYTCVWWHGKDRASHVDCARISPAACEAAP